MHNTHNHKFKLINPQKHTQKLSNANSQKRRLTSAILLNSQTQTQTLSNVNSQIQIQKHNLTNANLKTLKCKLKHSQTQI